MIIVHSEHAAAPDGMAWVPAGTYLLGSDRHYQEEAPAFRARLDGFWMDQNAVTNEAFSRFVTATGYLTLAERAPDARLYPGADPSMLVPGALVFRKTAGPVDIRDVSNWWCFVAGACWQRPEGPGSDLRGREAHPVVQVAYEDAAAYAAWAGRDLPTEAEWEAAARGGLEGAEFVWGEQLMPEGRHMANIWQGAFPWQNTAEDGWEGTAPVGSFPANGYGLHDMAGNVWQWTQDWYGTRATGPAARPCCAAANPRGANREASYDPAMPGIRIPRKVVKGGSFLCAPSYCRRYRPAARHAEMIDTATSHIGFRCVLRPSTPISG
jgi:formylglycine-generating enzyme required for sulfatase activity